MLSKDESSGYHHHLHYHNHSQPVVNIVHQNIILHDRSTRPVHELVDLTRDSVVEDDDSHTEVGSDLGAVDDTGPRKANIEYGPAEDDYMDDADFDRFLENWSAEQCVRVASPPVQQPNAIPLIEYNGLTVGMGVELLASNFVRIKEILAYGNGDIMLRGPYFQKLDDLPSVFPKRDREICWLTRDEADGRVRFDQEVSVTEVQDVVDIYMTNVPWKKKVDLSANSYVCRFVWHATQDKSEWIVRYLTADEADSTHRMCPRAIRQEWRGYTTPYGSAKRSRKHPPASAAESPRLRRQYTFGDAFCGAGGVSVGAWKAGLRVKYGVDFDQRACETYRNNFRHSFCYFADFNSWIALQDGDEFRVDISHGSPPCQTFSPAHTRSYNQQRDEENSSLIFTASDMIKKVRSRIHTMEETFGLANRQHRDTFYTVLQGILECGYSIHSKIVACEQYGIPQTRKRLVVIAAGPGDKLPPFPAPTHGPGPGLRPYVTIREAIHNIPRDAPDHSLYGTAFQNGQARAPYDENTQARTITCGGGERNYHPSGLRRFTIRELARLQTFPDEYPFSSAYAKKQIGNAVPPRLAEVLYRAAIQSLQETDEQESTVPIVID